MSVGGQSSLSMSRLKLNLKILGKILVSNTGGGSIIFHHIQAKPELKKNLGDILVSKTGGQSSFTMVRINLNLKILGKNLVDKTGDVNHLS